MAKIIEFIKKENIRYTKKYLAFHNIHLDIGLDDVMDKIFEG
jgi:uncharacterized Fe-S cluster-containing MiaB family protein